MVIQNIKNLTSSTTPLGSSTAEGARANVAVSNAGAPHAVAEQKQAVDAKPDSANLQSAVDNINKSLKQRDSTLQFSVDSDTKRNVVRMLDSGTGEVIRQYPSEEALAISKAIDQEIKHGLLLNHKA